MNKKKSEVILPSKSRKTVKKPKKTANKNIKLYSSLSYKRKAKKEAEAKKAKEKKKDICYRVCCIVVNVVTLSRVIQERRVAIKQNM